MDRESRGDDVFPSPRPYHSGGGHNQHFVCQNTDWLRKRAVTTAMRSTTFQPGSPGLSGAQRRDDCFSTKHEGSASFRCGRDWNSALQAISPHLRYHVRQHMPQNSYPNIEGFESSLVGRSSPRLTHGAVSNLAPANVLPGRDVLASDPDGHDPRTFDPCNSSPPQFIEDPNSWLLPRPLRHGLELETPMRASRLGECDGYGLPPFISGQTPPSLSSGDREENIRLSTPTPSRTDNPGRDSIYFQQMSGRLRSHQSIPGTPTSYATSARPSQQEPQTPSDPFKISKTHSHKESFSVHRFDARRHSRDQSASWDADAMQQIETSSSLHNHVSNLDSPSNNPVRPYGPSDPLVVSAAWTRTLTPGTSPNEFARISQRREKGVTRLPLRHAEMWRLTESPTPTLVQQARRRHVGLVQPAPPDSSILTPPAHRTHSKYHPVPEIDIGQLNVLDFDLGSDSDSAQEVSLDNGKAGCTRGEYADDGTNSVPSGVSDVPERDYVVCAISESRSSDVIGLAVINIAIARVDIIRIVSDDRYQRLIDTIWRMPTLPQTFLVLKKIVDENSKSSLALRLKQEFPDADLVPLEREHWNESEGLRLIDRFAWKKDIKAIRSDLEKNFYASCAFAAVSYTLFCQLTHVVC